MSNIQYEVDLIGEVWDDDSGEIIHNHFDCPICLKKYARTDSYYELGSDDLYVTCNECSAEFMRVSEYWYCDLVLEVVNMKGNENAIS